MWRHPGVTAALVSDTTRAEEYRRELAESLLLLVYITPCSTLCAAITNYRIVAVPVGGGNNITVTGLGTSLPGGLLQFSFAAGSALAPGQQYRVYAYAVNTAGTSLPSALASYTSPAT